VIEAAQIKAARALLGLNQFELSELAGVGINTVKRVELADEITGSARTLWKIQSALEAAGVEFIPADDEKGPGLRLKHKVRGKRVKRAGMRGKSA
jgi:transcriptional regulator with XRE-family HTH domain